MSRARMSGSQRREQILTIAREIFAEKGFEAASVEEVAARAKVSKPVIYEHFRGKEGMYDVIVDREVSVLHDTLATALQTPGHPREVVERTALAFLDYITDNKSGFRILVRDSPTASSRFGSLLGDLINDVEYLLAAHFKQQGLDASVAPLYAQMLVGNISQAGKWWLDAKGVQREQVAAHVVNLCWYGLRSMNRTPTLAFPLPQNSKMR